MKSVPGRSSAMASDPKATPVPSTSTVRHRDQGIRIFSYPKVIFIFPTMITALICGFGMLWIGNRVDDPVKARTSAVAKAGGNENPPAPKLQGEELVHARHQRFKSPANMFGILFLGIFAFNLLIMAIDFPRFTVVAVLLLILLATFILLWVGAYFELDLFKLAR